jgi:two-component system phosphate regulon sensor histidine kinase PhoR
LVNVGVAIDKDLLKNQLLEQLKKHGIYFGFEFAIFNPQEEQMDEGFYVLSNGDERLSEFEFPVSPEHSNYFVIHFPDRSSFFNSRLSIWYFLSGLLLIVLLFFGYTLSVIIRQRQLSEIQKNFINNLTHELKTPISSIALSANVLTDKEIIKSPTRLLKYAHIILEQNNRLQKNVEKVLNLATIEKSRLHLNLENIHLKSFFTEVITQFKDSDIGQKTKVRLIGFDNAVSVHADKFHFSNLVYNLLENAAKYCEKSPTIEIELKSNNGKRTLFFKDNGIGIPKEHRKKIFTKFYRVPTGNVHNVKGFGLGLDYVQKITKAHHWNISVDENPDGGSIFALIIQK